MLAPAFSSNIHPVAVIKTIASQHKGVKELLEEIITHQQMLQSSVKKTGYLLKELITLFSIVA